MARPRKPTSVLELTGAFKKNPQRRAARANEPMPTGPIGDPPAYFSAREKTVWREVVAILPPGVLTITERQSVEVYSRLMARYRQYGSGTSSPLALSNGELSRLQSYQASFGMSPSDRAKLGVAKPQRKNEEKANRFAQLDEEAATVN